MVDRVPGHLKKTCSVCDGSGRKKDGIGVCERCNGTGTVALDLDDLRREEKLRPVAPQRFT